MEWNEYFTSIFEQTLPILERTIKDLTLEELNKQPHPDCNSIGWIVWHLTRVQDSIMSNITGGEQLWIKDKWYVKFNRSSDPADNGGGHTPEDLAKFKSPDADTLLAYHSAVLENSRKYLTVLTTDGLSKEVENPRFQTPPTAARMLMIILSDGLQHVGQVGYIRGLIKAQG
jgi:uncharacterized damage-inducible protein DinB